jgi:hypothetical protein
MDIGDAYIELIENHACDNKEQLERREGQIMRTMDCVNTQLPGRTRQEYREEHKEAISAREKEYREKNKERRQTKIECGCGAVTSRYGISHHRNTKKHQIWLQIHTFIYL